MDALQIEMQEMVLRCRGRDDEEWMVEAARLILGIDFKKQMSAGSRKGMRASGSPLQVRAVHTLSSFQRFPFGSDGRVQLIEFPNFLQRTHKLYVDWDKMLSDVESRTHFLPSSSSGADGVVERLARYARRNGQFVVHCLAERLKHNGSQGAEGPAACARHPARDRASVTADRVRLQQQQRPGGPRRHQGDCQGGDAQGGGCGQGQDLLFRVSACVLIRKQGAEPVT